MTDMEISGDIRHAAIDALIKAGFVDPDDGTVPRWHDGDTTPVWTVPAQVVDVVLAAALPHLQADTKAMCETATQVGYALGRKEAAEEIAVALEDYLPYYSEEFFPADGTSIDCIAAKAMRHAYPNAARIARDIGKGNPT
jgi:hypothetical protein